ncbi:MAG: hypothetical protein U0103_15285 [Candidatus Obscuribacterales bacterium]|jgi:hypothetical protein|nr:hypothetical protein [Cyanobacteria bacterium SZAS LIN-5]RTL44671.1 MAG: hypothetical protein EKK48_05320 [Candidatus Melainabacteria bacterium]
MKSLANTYVAYTSKQAVQRFLGADKVRGGSTGCQFSNIREWLNETPGASPKPMHPQSER